MTVYVVGKQFQAPTNATMIDTTSGSKDFGRQLSPFFLGPVKLYDGYEATNVENAWQFSKLYAFHADSDGEPTEEYWDWARTGWADTWAHRYPMGKGAVPLCSLWDGKRYDYILARQRIYIPCYAKAVYRTEAFKQLKELTRQKSDIYLKDFDGYDYRAMGMSLVDVMNLTKRKMGHAFVLAMLLDNYSGIIEQLNL